MEDLIYSPVGRFTSVRDPYMTDRFVSGLFTQPGVAAQARPRFGQFLETRPLLPLLLQEIAAAGSGAAPLEVVDCGVFMGNFAIAAALQADRVGVPVRLSAYEANPALAAPIAANLALYGVEADVHARGIGGAPGKLEFVHGADGLIGGTVYHADRKRSGAAGTTTVECEIIPLKDALSGTPVPGLVKIDIEGNEVDAFGSIAGDAARLNNVFLVEFAPFQGRLPIAGTTYAEFLLAQFEIIDVGNWLWVPVWRPLADARALADCLTGERSRVHNTDLLLVPKALTALRARLAAEAATIPRSG